MPPRSTGLTRRPDRANLVRHVRASHHGYQRTGRTSLNAERAERRDKTVFDLIGVLTFPGQTLLAELPPHPQRADYHRNRNELRSDFSHDTTLRRDLRTVRFNPSGPPPTQAQLAQTVVDAVVSFKQAIDASAASGKKAKKRQRAQAWARFNMVLSAVDMGFLAQSNSDVGQVGVVAAGSLR